MSLIVKMILLKWTLALSLSLTSTDERQCFVDLSLNSNLQLINGVLNDLEM